MPSLWPDNGPAEVIEALADALRIANFKGDRLEAKRLFRQLEHEGKAGREAVSPARRLTKFERCKQWLIGLIGTVERDVRVVYREGFALHDFSEKTIRRALAALGAIRTITGRRRRKRCYVRLPQILGKTLASIEVLTSIEPPPAAIPFKPGNDKRLTEMGKRAKQGLPVITKHDADLADGEGLDVLHLIDRRIAAAKRKR